MKTKAFHVFIILSLLGCNALAPVDPFIPLQNDAAIVTASEYVSHTSTELTMDVDLVVLNSFYIGFDNNYLLKEDVEVTGDGIYDIVSFQKTLEKAPTDAACVLLLIDQSESYLEEDPFNSRSQSFSKFAHDVVVHDQLLIAGASNVKIDSRVEFSSDNFNDDANTQSAFIYALSKRTGGTTSLEAATPVALDKLSSCGHSRKHLVVFYHSEWLSQQKQDELIAQATSENVVIHLISIGNDRADEFQYSALATETNGFHIACPSVLEVNKVFSELSRLLSQQRAGYRMRIKFQAPPGNLLVPGSTTRHTIQITDPYTGKNYNPVFVNLTIPS
jgi:hypothetical protein